MFRGLLGVHSRYGLPARGVPEGPFASKAPAVLLPPLPLRLLPAGGAVSGWELHPLKIAALARRTRGRSSFQTPLLVYVGKELRPSCVPFSSPRKKTGF